MTRRECDAFRREFEPGLRGPHTEACLGCRAWAEEVESWRAMGAHADLPHALRARLVAISLNDQVEPLESAASRSRHPLPPALRARLLRIPAKERARLRVVKTRYAVAASYLLAGLLTLAAGRGSAVPSPAARDLVQASSRGSEVLLGVGGWIVENCEIANESMEKLFCRLGSRPASAEAPAAPATKKETPDGIRKAP